MNHILQYIHQEIQRGVPRHPMAYKHTKEWDEYYELKPEGKRALQHLAHWINPNHTLKVRRTFEKATGELKASIIKTRVADLDIYSPRDSFDYRLSVSVESPWDGPEEHLITSSNDAGADRMKDRLSYKHRDYQIDLTQIMHRNADHKDHEVEIEINAPALMAALDGPQREQPELYEKCVNGFVDNIRILAQKATDAISMPPLPTKPPG